MRSLPQNRRSTPHERKRKMATRKLTVATVLDAAQKVLFVWGNNSTFSVKAFEKADVEASVK